jgi:hypothetical protein
MNNKSATILSDADDFTVYIGLELVKELLSTSLVAHKIQWACAWKMNNC